MRWNEASTIRQFKNRGWKWVRTAPDGFRLRYDQVSDTEWRNNPALSWAEHPSMFLGDDSLNTYLSYIGGRSFIFALVPVLAANKEERVAIFSIPTSKLPAKPGGLRPGWLSSWSSWTAWGLSALGVAGAAGVIWWLLKK